MRTEDGDVIRECLNGDSGSFGLLVDKYKAGIFALAYSKLCNFHDAEDVTQEVFLKAYKNLHTLKRWDSFFIWIRSMTINFCKDKIKSHSRRIDSEYIEEQSQSDLENISLNSYQEDQWLASHKETLALLDEAMKSLPETYRQVLALHYLGGMSGERISQFLGISHANVRQRLNRAREQLREEMATVMDQTFQQQKLSASFTFRIVEMVKKIKINPISDVRNIPWGLSIGAGLIFTVLMFGQHIPFNLPDIAMGLPLPSDMKILKVGEIPVDVVKVSTMTFIGNKGNGEGIAPDPKGQENAFMAPQAEGGNWEKRADMPAARKDINAVAVNGKIYVIGGSGAAYNVSANTFEYDPLKDQWKEKADMPTARNGACLSVLDGKIYV
ncbi:MAG: sigma-70 family RNA polymerase sigma factor, partial [Candidatus Poribacteria bacterium]